MSVADEQPITQSVGESPQLHPGAVKDLHARELLIRFAAGAATSVAAGLITLAFGPRVGGLFLAFPAILMASLTLIEDEEDGAEAREDARGAVLGGLALAAFAAVAAVTLLVLPGAAGLALASAAWLLVAVGGYFVLWR